MYMHIETISLTRGVCSCHSSQPRTWHPSPWPSLSAHHGKGSWNHSTQIQHQTRGREGEKEVGGRRQREGRAEERKEERKRPCGMQCMILADLTFRHTAKFSGHNIFYGRVNLTMISSKGTFPSVFDSETAWGKIRLQNKQIMHVSISPISPPLSPCLISIQGARGAFVNFSTLEWNPRYMYGAALLLALSPGSQFKLEKMHVWSLSN